MKISHKTILVTGSSKRIGQEIAYYLAKTFASGIQQVKTISLECGLQNGTLAIFVSTQIFGNDILYAVPTAAYALIMYITGFIFIYILRRSN